MQLKKNHIPKHKYAEHAPVMDSSALPKWHTEFLSEWIINRVNEYFTLVMEPFNSPNRGNDILSNGCYLKRGGELFNVVNRASIL